MSFDVDWFSDCSNTYHEETKQLAYASRMGLLASNNGAHPPSFNLSGRSGMTLLVIYFGGIMGQINKADWTYVSV